MSSIIKKRAVIGILIVASISLQAQLNPGNAYINARGCVVCDQYAPGDSFSLDNGQSWIEAVDKPLLQQRYNSGADLSRKCISLVTTHLNNFFEGDSLFDQDISSWDVSNVGSMALMFHRADSFNQPIGNWDVDSVVNMNGMFYGARRFDQPIGSWDVSRVRNMASMFRETDAFDQPIGNWNTAQVTDMARMFREAKKFDQNIDSWDVSKVTNLYHLFSKAEAFNQPLNSWDVTSVTNMAGAFRGTISFDQPLDNWDVSTVQNMYNLFSLNPSFNQDIGMWDVSSATNMKTMFQQATAFDQDIGQWDVQNVSDMTAMFKGASSFDQDLSEWCVINIPALPQDFSLNCPLDSAHFPLWGGCPNFSAPRDARPLIEAFPQPVATALFVHAPPSSRIRLLDFQGRSLLVQRAKTWETVIDMAAQASGIYVLEVFDGREVHRMRIVKN